MSSKRPAVLMAFLLLLLAGYALMNNWSSLPFAAVFSPEIEQLPQQPIHVPPPRASAEIASLNVHQNAIGIWTADFDYSYKGERFGTILTVELPPSSVRMVVPNHSIEPTEKKHVSVALPHPGPDVDRTTEVVVRMSVAGGDIASATIAQMIQWPDLLTFARKNRLAGKSLEQQLDEAITVIDAASTKAELEEAKFILELIVQQNPRFSPAYIELARVAMKTNWGPAGLHQAEKLLQSALTIDSESANAKILLGYVYAHQEHFAKAEALFVDAARSEPKNLWLWANWGEVLAMQGKFDLAANKYREAITRPRTHDTYDRARLDAFEKLLSLREKRKDLDGIEALHKQRVEEFGAESCHGVAYAKFVLLHRGDAARAIDMARVALNAPCAAAEAREVLGLAHYVTWAGAKGEQQQDALHQARMFLPPSPKQLYLLASSEKTKLAARKLVATGENIDQKDNDNWTALAYALQQEDIATAQRLLVLGARPELPVGYNDIPTALLPVIEGNLEQVHLLQKFGANYAKLEYQGMTAFEFAKMNGDHKLLEALQGASAPVL